MPRLFVIVALLLLIPLPLHAEGSPPENTYDLAVSFDLPASRITGLATVKVQAGKEFAFRVDGLSVTMMLLNGAAIRPVVQNGTVAVTPDSDGVLSIEYTAVLKNSTLNRIDPAGVLLTGTWYPKMNGRMRYRMRAILPAGYDAVSEAEQIETIRKEAGTEFVFRFDRELDGISLIASNRFEVLKDSVNGVDLYAYCLREDRSVAQDVLASAKQQLLRYEKLLPPFPFRRFSLVETPYPAELQRPTFSLFSRSSLRPLLENQPALARELMKQWFGASVTVNIDRGDWSEGLITYLSGRLYEEQNARQRKDLLLDYGAFVNSGNEISLRDFKGGTDRAGLAVARDKGAMVFHMLKRLLGRDSFFNALKTLVQTSRDQPASWDDIRSALEKQSGKDLTAFFSQWVDRKGLPSFSLESPSVKRNGDSFDIAFRARQGGTPYALELPAVISIKTGTQLERTLTLDSESKSFELSIDSEPRRILADSGYDMARYLSDEEWPPLIIDLLGPDKLLLVRPVSHAEAYASIVSGLKHRGAADKDASDIRDADLKDASVVILGRDNPLIMRLFGSLPQSRAGFSVLVKKNPWNSGRVIAVMDAQSREEADAAYLKLPAFALRTEVQFDHGTAVSETTEDTQEGVTMELREPTLAIDLSALGSLDDVIRRASGKKIIYVGEYHDKFAHHAVELQVIKSLYEKNPKLAIGMEMFQRPFQPAVDDYVNGAIDERTFLKKTEYFKRWGFDYNLYKPILDFAREHKIPVVALNQRKEITDKVAKSGLDSLTDEERKHIPKQMDFANEEYRSRLKAVFEQHKSERAFDYFYQAQILWDETMAESVDQFLQKHPDDRMVVIAGAGHVAYGAGIPKRAFRRNSLPYFIAINDGDADRQIADYLVLPPALDGTTAPRLMAVLQPAPNGVKVMALPDNSVAKKAGIQVGDTILALDKEKIESVEDVRLVLFYKKTGDTVNVTAVRKRFLLGDKQMQFTVQLQ